MSQKNNETFIQKIWQFVREKAQKIYGNFIAAASILIGVCAVLFCVRRRADNNRKLYKDHGADDSRIRQSIDEAKRAAEEARSTIEKIKKHE